MKYYEGRTHSNINSNQEKLIYNMTEHQSKCEAPICMDCPDKTTVWYAGEKICKLEPMTKLQRKQHNINNLTKIGKYKFKEMAHTVETLEKSIVK